MNEAQWLPLIFAGLMALSILIYVILDGYDLGVGILFMRADDAERDRMIASIGPFWDANETWLVLAVGLLLVAFPKAHGVVLSALYLPVFVMLIGLILRGVAFDFRAKVKQHRKATWCFLFWLGSLLATLSQGFMLGLYLLGLEITAINLAFASLCALCFSAGYAFIGATWLILKTDGELQRRAVRWARYGLLFVVVGLAAISLASPLASERIFERWFSWPQLLWLAPLPLLSLALLALLYGVLRRLPAAGDRWAWLPFVATCGLFVLAFIGLAYSFYPYVVPEKLTLYQAASSPESLRIILWGALLVLPAIVAYTLFAYYVFRGKASNLHYD